MYNGSYCVNCGEHLPPNARFCPTCGVESEGRIPRAVPMVPTQVLGLDYPSGTISATAVQPVYVPVPPRRNPVATFFRRLLGVVAGLPLIAISLYAFWNGWLIISGFLAMDVQRIGAGLVIEAIMAVVGAVLFAIVRWGFELGD